MREALFSCLGPRVQGALVVDLYAGSGALGLEALSRGAREALFVESAPAALRALERNVRALGAEACARIVAGDAEAFLRGGRGRVTGVGVLFADPPYGSADARFVERIAGSPALGWSEGALIVVETSARDALPEPVAGWRRWRERAYGETRILIEERESDHEQRDQSADEDRPLPGDV